MKQCKWVNMKQKRTERCPNDAETGVYCLFHYLLIKKMAERHNRLKEVIHHAGIG